MLCGCCFLALYPISNHKNKSIFYHSNSENNTGAKITITMNKPVLNIQRLDPVDSLTGCEKCAAM